jgi:hypothetical protein
MLLTQKYSFQTERIPETITIIITIIETNIILIIICEQASVINVSLINGAPLAAHNREHDRYISFITLYRGCTLYP